MPKVYAFTMISLDGYFEGPNHDLSWHNTDQQFADFANKQLLEIDTLVFGRRTYQMMAEYWPSEQGQHDDPQTAELMNALPKLVFSHSLTSVNWSNSRLATASLADEINGLKAKATKDIAIFGSSNLCTHLIAAGLIDEFRLMVNPVVLGQGSTLFSGITQPLNLHLTATWPFDNGNMLLTYQPR